MKHSEIKALAEGVGPIVSELLAKATASFKAHSDALASRLDALEKRLNGLPAPKNGKDADIDEAAAKAADLIRSDLEAVRAAVEAIDIPAPMEVDIDAIAKAAVALMPAPKDADPEAVAAIVRDQMKGDLAELRSAVDAIVIPEPVELPDIPAMVAEAVNAMPAPKDGQPGKSITADDVAPVIRDEVAKAVSAIPAAKDGVGLAGALIDREGNLVVTLTNGEAKTLGPVVGKDADPAQPGRDGLGFEDMGFEEKDGRLYAVFRRGEVVKEARLPGISYRGVWKSGEYLTGDSVTFGACQWIATQDTDEKPGEGRAWQLAVRKGRDGRDGEAKPAKAAEPIRVGVPKGDK